MDDARIIYVHTGIWPSPSPSTVFVTGTAFGLANQVPTTLIVRTTSLDSTETIFHSISGTKLPDTLEIIRMGYEDRLPGHTAFFIKAVRLIGQRAAAGKVRAVITRNMGFLPFMLYLRRRFRIPCFFETHDFYGDFTLRSDLKKTPGILKKHWYERLFLPRLDGIICLTEPQAACFRKRYPNIPCLVANTGLFRVEQLKTARMKRVCYIGSLDPHKGLGTALSALKQTANTELRLLVVGGKSDHEKQVFKNFAHLVGVGDRVDVMGWLRHADLGHVINTCIAGLVPLRDTPFNRYITSPLKILDCLANGLPVIASNLPSVREYLTDGKTGLLFEPDNAEHLSQTLDRYCAGDFYALMAPNVVASAQAFLWTARGEKIVRFLNNTGDITEKTGESTKAE